MQQPEAIGPVEEFPAQVAGLDFIRAERVAIRHILGLDETQKKHEAQQALPALPDAEELSFLAEEAEKLTYRLDAVCNRILYGRPHNSTLLHWVAQELRAHTSTVRWWLEHHGKGS